MVPIWEFRDWHSAGAHHQALGGEVTLWKLPESYGNPWLSLGTDHNCYNLSTNGGLEKERILRDSQILQVDTTTSWKIGFGMAVPSCSMVFYHPQNNIQYIPP